MPSSVSTMAVDTCWGEWRSWRDAATEKEVITWGGRWGGGDEGRRGRREEKGGEGEGGGEGRERGGEEWDVVRREGGEGREGRGEEGGEGRRRR